MPRAPLPCVTATVWAPHVVTRRARPRPSLHSFLCPVAASNVTPRHSLSAPEYLRSCRWDFADAECTTACLGN